MNLTVAKRIAKELMKEHGLDDWKFEYDRAVRRFGVCKRKKKVISLSKPLTKLNDEIHVQDTILHEIAHALTKGGHNYQWRLKCREIGCEPTRTYNADVERLKYKYNYKCTGVECPVHGVRYKKLNGAICSRCKSDIEWIKI